MVLIKDINLNNSFTKELSKPYGTFQTAPSLKTSKSIEFFEELYSYPPKFKIKWDGADEFSTDLFLSDNYSVIDHSFPFLDFLEDWLFYSEETASEGENYSLSQLKEGYLDKVNSDKFYKRETTNIQKALSSTPIYAILNGQNEIVLTKPTNTKNSPSSSSYLKQFLYENCGAFDPYVEKKSKYGFFFMTPDDAELYLSEVAKSDMDGTKTVGLSIHCLSLESAYKITREHHPGIDFRFVPNFKEVKSLLKKDVSKPFFIIDDNQQQLRFRPRSVNLFPYLGKVGRWISPARSFLQRSEYFKGVPVYIVQIKKDPRNLPFEQYYQLAGTLDCMYSRIIQYFDKIIGFGHNWIMQGSLYDAGCSDNFVNYVFFEKEEAKSFVKKFGRKVARYRGSRTSNLELIVRKPKIFVYNLEDFIEVWEEKLQRDKTNNVSKGDNTIFEASSTIMVPPKSTSLNNINLGTSTKQRIIQGLGLKYRLFKNFVGIFFSVGYN